MDVGHTRSLAATATHMLVVERLGDSAPSGAGLDFLFHAEWRRTRVGTELAAHLYVRPLVSVDDSVALSR